MSSAVWQFAGSVAAVSLLVLLAWKFGFAGPPELTDENEARALASEVPGGFEAVRVSLDRSRRAALLGDAKGRVVLVAPAGAHFIARALGPGVAVSLAGSELTVRCEGRSATLELGTEAGDWAEAISQLQ